MRNCSGNEIKEQLFATMGGPKATGLKEILGRRVKIIKMNILCSSTEVCHLKEKGDVQLSQILVSNP